jgi:hypothetical protein
MSRARLKSVDFYRKIPKDMTEGTIPGSVISVLASLVIAMLLVSEISTYLTPQFNTRVVVDRSLDGDLMRINFNVSFPALSCEFASVDVGDAMGLNRYNLTKTVFKRPIDADLNPLGPIQWERGEKQKPVEHADELQHDKAQALVKYHTEERARDPTGKRRTSAASLGALSQNVRDGEEAKHGVARELLRAVVPVVAASGPGVESLPRWKRTRSTPRRWRTKCGSPRWTAPSTRRCAWRSTCRATPRCACTPRAPTRCAAGASTTTLRTTATARWRRS